MIVAKKSQTLWLASEGDDSVTELPLMAAAPMERPRRVLGVGLHYRDPKIIGSGYVHNDGIPGHCGAPSGLALNADETLLYIFCRSSYDVATLRIAAAAPVGYGDRGKEVPWLTVARVADDLGDEEVSRGRRLFYGARDDFSSGGMGCAGCHPEGRDDGHVWHEVFTDDERKRGNFLGSKYLAFETKGGKLGYPRQTPMLAGRVSAKGPYGWHAQNPTLRERLAEGFDRHRWFGTEVDPSSWMVGVRASALQAFLRSGLVTPPKITRALSEQEQQGKAIFESDIAQCSQCHLPETDFTNRELAMLRKREPPPDFETDPKSELRTPSLLFTGGTPPYYHDGHAPTLAALIAQNGDRMGRTKHLGAAEQAALVAYLETL
jgi:cytochrome c peroxidase